MISNPFESFHGRALCCDRSSLSSTLSDRYYLFKSHGRSIDATTIVRFNASSVERDNETIFTDMALEIGVERRGKMEKIRALEFVSMETWK